MHIDSNWQLFLLNKRKGENDHYKIGSTILATRLTFYITVGRTLIRHFALSLSFGLDWFAPYTLVVSFLTIYISFKVQPVWTINPENVVLKPRRSRIWGKGLTYLYGPQYKKNTASAWRATNTPGRHHFIMYKNNLSLWQWFKAKSMNHEI